METADVVVLGAGIIGASTAYYLSRDGHQVVLLDSHGLLGSGGASQACAGGVRHQGRHPEELPFATQALKLWRHLESELDADLGYRQDGMAVVTDEEELIAVLEERVVREKAAGLEIELLGQQALHERVPGVSPRMLAGSYCPLDGHADPLKTISALIRHCRQQGVRLHLHTAAQEILVRKGRVCGVLTARNQLSCRHVVLATGAWSRTLAASAGLNLPIKSFALQMMVTPRRPHALDPVLAWLGHGVSLKQVPSGTFVIGGGWPGLLRPSSHAADLIPGSLAKSARTVSRLYPAIGRLPVIRAWAGVEGFCDDELQLLGPVNRPRGLIVAAGFSGHGFALGPGVGNAIARYLTTGDWPRILEPFSLDRFAGHSDSKIG